MTAWEQAFRLKHRAFYEPATDTIRLCPENYCIATRDGGARWIAYRDEHATIAKHDEIQRLLNEWQGGSTAPALASVLASLFPQETQS